MSVSEWAAAHRILGPHESGEPGRWKNARTPYLVGPMDAFSDPDVEVIVLCFAAQAGKTEVLLNCLGYSVDQDPGPGLIVYSSERDADKTLRNRVHPMLFSSPALQRHLSGNPDDVGLKELHFDSATWYTAWANSPAALSSTPVRYLVLDEVDKYPSFAGREANPIKLAQVRTRTYRGRRKIIVVSTPTFEHGEIWKSYQHSNRCEFWVPCPHCGGFQVLDFFSGVKWEKDTPFERMRKEKLAWYECCQCHGRILDHHKPAMLSAGRWVPAGCTVAKDGGILGEPPSRRVSGFNLSALYSPWCEFSEIAVEFLQSVHDRGNLMNFFNSWLGQPWKEKLEELDEKKILARRKKYQEGVVDKDAIVLTCGVDVQESHFFYTVRAWGLKERSWLVRHGMATSWSDVEKVICARYSTPAGKVFPIRRALIDSGYKTEEVYRFTQRLRPVTWPSKGSANPGLGAPIRLTKPEAGILLYHFKSDYWKDKLARYISTADGETGEWNLPAELDPEYIRQMTSERRVIDRKQGRIQSHWETASEHSANHYWDTEVLNLIAADAEGVRYLDDVQPVDAKLPSSPQVQESTGWLQGEQWMRAEDRW